MKTRKAIFAALMPIIGLIANAQVNTKEHIIPVESNIQDLTIIVESANGHIQVTGDERNDVAIYVSEYITNPIMKAIPKPNNPAQEFPADTSGMKKIKGKSTGYTINKEGNKIYIKSDHSHVGFNSFGYVIDVPYNCSVVAKTTFMGDITVFGLKGGFELNTLNGKIEAMDVSGAVVANSVNGNILSTVVSLNDDTPTVYSTVNGHIDVSLPKDIKATLKLDSEFGEIFTDFDLDFKTSTEENTHVGYPQLHSVSVKNWMIGEANGGGPDITFKTLSGNIYIRKY